MAKKPEGNRKWPAANIEWRQTHTLLAYERNSRIHPDIQIDKIARSMTEFGWTTPVLVDEDSIILAGHGRCLAAAKLGISEVPVMIAKGWTEAQKIAYRIWDNESTLQGAWDTDMLKFELTELGKMDYDLALTGFDDIQLVQFMATPNVADPDDVPDPPSDPVSRINDVWLLGRHRLVCGDITDEASLLLAMQSNLADIVVTSPPYNQGIDSFTPSGMHKEGGWVKKVGHLAYPDAIPEDEYQDRQRELLDILFDVISPNGSLFYNHKNRYREKRVISPMIWLPGQFSLRQEIIWSRPGSVTQNARMFLPSDERIYWMYKGKDFTFNDSTEIKSWSSVWTISPRANLDHAVAFPVEIPDRCIKATARSKSIVFDPFCGSGTTIIAAEMNNRPCVGIEMSPAYVDVAVQRWQTYTGKEATLESTGETHAQTAQKRAHGAQTIPKAPNQPTTRKPRHKPPQAAE